MASAAGSNNVPASFPYLELVGLFTGFVYVFYTYLDVRQLKAIKNPAPPKAMAQLVDMKIYGTMQAYQADKWWFGFWYGLVECLTTLLLLMYGFMPYAWRLSGELLQWFGWWQDNEVVQTVVFVLGTSAFSVVTDIPWGVYITFIIEARHGFNNTTWGTWVGDQIKLVLLGLVFIPPIVGALTWILQVSGPYVALYLWLFTFSLSIFMMTIYPVAIAPLFNKFDKLEEGSLKNAIEGLAGKLSFPLKHLYVMDGSKRSGHSNAYMYGFFKNKRIVLYDTLCQQCEESEVVAVLAHELGHWKLAYTPCLFAVSQAVVLLQYCLFTLVRNSDDLFSSFGFLDGQPVFVALMLFNYISAPMDKVVGYLSNVISRRFEFQADAFAVSLGHSDKLKDALLKLEKENKSTMHVDALYSAFHYSHLPLVERIRAINLRSVDADNSSTDKKAQ